MQETAHEQTLVTWMAACRAWADVAAVDSASPDTSPQFPHSADVIGMDFQPHCQRHELYHVRLSHSCHSWLSASSHTERCTAAHREMPIPSYGCLSQ